MFQKYFKSLYRRAMTEAYSLAHEEIVSCSQRGGRCLDCGASDGTKFDLIRQNIDFTSDKYTGIEWNSRLVQHAQSRGLDIIEGDLNEPLPFESRSFELVFGLSVLEHLLNPCRYIKESHRVLKNEGRLVILTPNISTFFTAALILLGKMPSSGPHPDSDQLIKKEELFKVSSEKLQPDTESDTPSHRHLVVFSFRVLHSYLELAGFRNVKGYGFGLYPFPNFMQPLLEKIDPYHCHQMVFFATK